MSTRTFTNEVHYSQLSTRRIGEWNRNQAHLEDALERYYQAFTEQTRITCMELLRNGFVRVTFEVTYPREQRQPEAA